MPEQLDEVLQLVSLIAHRTHGGDYIFRGEPECHDKVSSSLYRQYQNIDADYFDIEIVQREILEQAKRYTHETNEFEILTQLQHYGGKTNLIDFTTDYLIALFFACDGSPSKDGRVVLLLRSEANSGYIMHARNPTNRVIAQKSIFARPHKGFVEPDDIIAIPCSLKQQILDYLRTRHGISSATIYNDLLGFIRVQDIHRSAYTIFYEGRTFQLSGKYPQAIEHYTQALALDPQLPAAYNNRGNSYYHQGDADLAIQDYNKALAINPGDAAAYSNRGNAHMLKGNFAAAIQDHDRSLELDPGYSDTYYNRGNTHMFRGDLASAIQDYGKVLELTEGTTAVYAHYRRGIAWLRLSEWERARSDLAIVKERGIDIAAAFHSIGYARVTDFEQEGSIKLPKDIVEMLTG